MQLSAPIYHLKRVAKSLARNKNLPLHRALNIMARKEGFQSWSHLAAAHARQSPAVRLMTCLEPGDLMLLAARPGHGKTVLGLEMAVQAQRDGRPAVFFTLDYTREQVEDRLTLLERPQSEQDALDIDASDEICADYIVQSLKQYGGSVFAVVDYLQLLDQRRSEPELDVQLGVLRRYATETGSILVLLAQISRAFERAERPVPDWSDLRLPNPMDLDLIDKACFLHEGRMVLQPAA